MKAAGLPLERPAMSVLVTLHLAGQPLRIGEIATRMQVVGPHVTRQVNELARRGLVRRVTDPVDQRARLIEPTSEGSAATDRYMRIVLGWFTEALADWPERTDRTSAVSSGASPMISPPTWRPSPTTSSLRGERRSRGARA